MRAVLDWEMSTLGDPLSDAALMCVYRHPMFDMVHADAAWASPLIPSADELAQRYSRRRGSAAGLTGTSTWRWRTSSWRSSPRASQYRDRMAGGTEYGDKVGEAVAPLIAAGLAELSGDRPARFAPQVRGGVEESRAPQRCGISHQKGAPCRPRNATSAPNSTSRSPRRRRWSSRSRSLRNPVPRSPSRCHSSLNGNEIQLTDQEIIGDHGNRIHKFDAGSRQSAGQLLARPSSARRIRRRCANIDLSTYLRPSRYAEADKFFGFAATEFGEYRRLGDAAGEGVVVGGHAAELRARLQ